MTPEEMLLEPLRPSAADRLERAPAVQPLAPPVPPVRTIVLDRAPVPVLPPDQREALREAASSGAERLSLDSVGVAYGAKQAVKSVSLSVHQGEVLALIGPSGCGKTTLLRTLNRLTELTPSAGRSGRIMLDGEDIHDFPDTTLRSAWRWSSSSPTRFRCPSSTTSPSPCASSRAGVHAGGSSSRW